MSRVDVVREWDLAQWVPTAAVLALSVCVCGDDGHHAARMGLGPSQQGASRLVKKKEKKLSVGRSLFLFSLHTHLFFPPPSSLAAPQGVVEDASPSTHVLAEKLRGMSADPRDPSPTHIAQTRGHLSGE